MSLADVWGLLLTTQMVVLGAVAARVVIGLLVDEFAPREGQKKTPATATNSPGAVIEANVGLNDAEKCSRVLVRKQTLSR